MKSHTVAHTVRHCSIYNDDTRFSNGQLYSVPLAFGGPRDNPKTKDEKVKLENDFQVPS